MKSLILASVMFSFVFVGCSKKHQSSANGVYDVTGETAGRADETLKKLELNKADKAYEYLYIKSSKEIYYLTVDGQNNPMLLEKHLYTTGDIFSGGNYTVETNCDEIKSHKQTTASKTARLVDRIKDKKMDRFDSKDIILFIQTHIKNKCEGMKKMPKPDHISSSGFEDEVSVKMVPKKK